MAIKKADSRPSDYISTLHKYNTRHKDSIITYKHQTKFFEKKPSYIGQRYLNTIPKEIKKESNRNKFKKRLKEYLIKIAPYSFEDFFHPSQS